MQSWIKFANIKKINSKKKNLVANNVTRFFLNKNKISKLHDVTAYIVPPVIDCDRSIVIDKVDYNEPESNIKIWYKDELLCIDSEVLEGRSLLIDENITHKIFGKDIMFDVGDRLVGLEVFDEKYGNVGKVKSVAGSNIQKYLIVDYTGRDVYIPLVDEIVKDIGKDLIGVILPEGLLDLNK